MRILIIDDDRSLIQVLRESINHYDSTIEVLEAVTAEDGIRQIQSIPLDLIILDYSLPDTDGLSVCKWIKSEPAASFIPVLVITGKNEGSSLKINFLECGADAFLNKPFYHSEIIAQIKALLRLKRAEDQIRSERDKLRAEVHQKNVALSKQEERWKLILDYVIGGIWDWDLISGTTSFSPEWYEELGYDEEDVGDDIEDFLALAHPIDKDRIRDEFDKYLTRENPQFNSEVRMKCKDGSYRWFLYRGHAIWDNNGKPLRILGIQSDITEQKQQFKLLEAIALYDSLTKLPNRVLFYDLTNKMLAATKRAKGMLGILFMDLDNFKEVNDNYGHHIGDEVLKVLGERLKDVMRPLDVLARFGGDEFVASVYDVKSPEELETIKSRFDDVLNRSVEVNGNNFTLGMSLGHSMYPDDGSDLDTLLRCADQNMYLEKNKKKRAK